MWFGNAGTGSASGEVESLAFAPDSRTLYTGVRGQVLAWDTSSRQRSVLVKATDPDTHNRFHLSPCGRFLLLLKADQVVVRRTITGAVVSRDKNPNATPLTDLSACGRYVLAYHSWDRRVVYRWDWAARHEVGPLVLNLPTGNKLQDWFALGTNGRAVFGDPTKQELGLYDSGDGAELWRVRVPDYDSWRVLFDGTGERVLLVGKLAELTCLLVSDGTILWSGKAGGRPSSASLFAFHPSRPLFAFVSPLGPLGYTTGDQSAWFGDLNTGERVMVPDPGFKRANCVAFSPDGLTCAIGSGSNKFCVFDLDC